MSDPAAEGETVSFGRRASLQPSHGASARTSDGRRIALFEVDGKLHALAGACLHRGGSIADGLVRDGIVTCPEHWWRYDIVTGRLVGDPSARLETYPVEVANGEIVVRVPAAAERTDSIRERLLALARSPGPRDSSG